MARTDSETAAVTVGSAYQRLTKRADFLAAAQGRRWNSGNFSVQIRRRAQDDAGPPRFGITVTKRVGMAVERNRIRRRLREAIARTAPVAARAGHDYVLIARASALKAPFDRLVADLAEALRHNGTAAPRGKR